MTYIQNRFREYEIRQRHIETVGFVAPEPDLAKFLATFGPWLEIGAGTGALAKAIREQGGACIATDNFTWQFFKTDQWQRNPDVQEMDAIEAAKWVAKPENNHFGLLSSWPNYDEDWCYRAVKMLQPGQRFGYIGEGVGGCTGCDKLHELLESDFAIMAQHPVKRLLTGIWDHCTVYKRK